MTDPVSAARSARQSLAQGLAALQTPGLPPQFMDAAEPIAQAMSGLHRIESSQGAALGEAAPSALDALRRALSLLQAIPVVHPAGDQAIEVVAASLGQVHGLAHIAQQQPAAAQGSGSHNQAAFAGTVMAEQMHPPAGVAPTTPHDGGQQYPQQGYGGAQPAASPYGPPPQAQSYQAAAPQQSYPQQSYPQQSYPQQSYPQQSYPQQAYPQQPPAAPAQQPPRTGQSPQVMADPWQRPAQAPPQQPHMVLPNNVPEAPRPTAAGRIRVEAELGAHSATNFYKGLSGNDIIDSGGIFVATYQIPPVGTEVVVKVSLPGGYEFEALGAVTWTRDPPQAAGAESPPGFGARFTHISPEGRQLVYRYVRNREPLFHDDL